MPDTATLARELIAHHLGVDDDAVVNTASFADDLGADSLDCVELTMAAEDAFEIQISDDESSKITTVGDAIKLIEAKVRERAAV